MAYTKASSSPIAAALELLLKNALLEELLTELLDVLKELFAELMLDVFSELLDAITELLLKELLDDDITGPPPHPANTSRAKNGVNLSRFIFIAELKTFRKSIDITYVIFLHGLDDHKDVKAIKPKYRRAPA